MKCETPRYTSGVYALVHPTRGVVYVGKSKRCVWNRCSWHSTALRRGFHENAAVVEAWEDGHSLEFKLLEACAPELCAEREIDWAQRLLPKSQWTRGHRVSAATKLNMMAAQQRLSLEPGRRAIRSEAAARGHRGGEG